MHDFSRLTARGAACSRCLRSHSRLSIRTAIPLSSLHLGVQRRSCAPRLLPAAGAAAAPEGSGSSGNEEDRASSGSASGRGRGEAHDSSDGDGSAPCSSTDASSSSGVRGSSSSVGDGGAAPEGSGGGGRGGGPAAEGAPWSMTFIQRERATLWTDENKERLVKIVAGGELGLSPRDVEFRLFELTTLVPGLAPRVSRLAPRLLAALLADTAGVAAALIALRGALPEQADVGRLVASRPELLLKDGAWLEREAARLEALLGCDRAALGPALSAEPRLFDAECVVEVLEELQRLLPGADAARVLLADPSWLTRVERGPKRLGQHPDM